jgi:hypothetical protein
VTLSGADADHVLAAVDRIQAREDFPNLAHMLQETVTAPAGLGSGGKRLDLVQDHHEIGEVVIGVGVE